MVVVGQQAVGDHGCVQTLAVAFHQVECEVIVLLAIEDGAAMGAAVVDVVVATGCEVQFASWHGGWPRFMMLSSVLTSPALAGASSVD